MNLRHFPKKTKEGSVKWYLHSKHPRRGAKAGLHQSQLEHFTWITSCLSAWKEESPLDRNLCISDHTSTKWGWYNLSTSQVITKFFSFLNTFFFFLICKIENHILRGCMPWHWRELRQDLSILGDQHLLVWIGRKKHAEVGAFSLTANLEIDCYLGNRKGKRGDLPQERPHC